MKLFQNKFCLVCLIIALVICAVTSTFAVMGYQGLAKNILGTVTTPFRWTFQRIADGFEGIGRYFTFKSVLIEQNDALKDLVHYGI